MLLTTGIVALSRKVSDRRAREKIAKQQLLRPLPENDIPEINEPSRVSSREGSWSNPREGSPTRSSMTNPSTLESDMKSIDSMSRAAASSPVGQRTLRTPLTTSNLENGATGMDHSPRENPPPYSPAVASPGAASSIYSQDSNTLNSMLSDSSSIAPKSVSDTGRGLRIRTKGSGLKSGFPYHPQLFDLKIRPELWERFTTQVTAATKLGKGDYAHMAAAATATALTGALVTSVWVGKSVNYARQEKKVKAGLENMSDGGLGEVLKSWNDTEFRKLGLFVHMELSEAAMKRPDQKSPTIRMPSVMYGSREERERKMEEQKFCLVVTQLDLEGVPADAIHLAEEAEETLEVPQDIPELSSPENVIFEVPELPGDEGRHAVELPAEVPGGVSIGYSDKFLPRGFAELDSTPIDGPTSAALKEGPKGATLEESDRQDLKDLEKIKTEEVSGDDDAALVPEPLNLMVTAETHAALHKEIT